MEGNSNMGKTLQSQIVNIRKETEKFNEEFRKVNVSIHNTNILGKKLVEIEEKLKQNKDVHSQLELQLIRLQIEEKIQTRILKDYRYKNEQLLEKFKKQDEDIDMEIKTIEKRLEECAKRADEYLTKKLPHEDVALIKKKMQNVQNEEIELAKIEGELEALNIIKDFQERSLREIQNLKK